MKPVYTIILLLAGTMLYAERGENVYTSEMYYDEAEAKWEESLNIPERASQAEKKNSGNTSNRIEYTDLFSDIKGEKDIRSAHIPNVVYFPEGFSMRIPKDTYEITREKGKYTFYMKETPGETANFEVYVTDFDLQASLHDNGYFCISKNKNLGMYAVYTVNKKTNTRSIHGFRLFYTLPIEGDKYVTVRSSLFKNYKQSSQYVNEIVNLNYGETYLSSINK